MWFPGLLLLPFAIGDLSDPARGSRGPALARALVQAGCLQVEQPAWYATWRPTAEIDSEVEQTVRESIVAAGKVEYADTYGATTGGKNAQEAAAKIAMESRLKSGSIDTFGFLEAVVSSPHTLKQFYTYALSGRQCVHQTNPCSGSCCGQWCCQTSKSHTASPYIGNYPDLDRLFNEHVRMCLVSQQKLEACFKDYRS